MTFPILGLHHVTATVDDAQADLDFALDALGMRLVKKTVNFDNRGVYHFYYGDESGTPGTLWTTFPYRLRNVPAGIKGAGLSFMIECLTSLLLSEPRIAPDLAGYDPKHYALAIEDAGCFMLEFEAVPARIAKPSGTITCL